MSEDDRLSEQFRRNSRTACWTSSNGQDIMKIDDKHSWCSTRTIQDLDLFAPLVQKPAREWLRCVSEVDISLHRNQTSHVTRTTSWLCINMLRKSDAKDHIIAHLHFGVGSCALEVRVRTTDCKTAWAYGCSSDFQCGLEWRRREQRTATGRVRIGLLMNFITMISQEEMWSNVAQEE